jgi:hypothetical protein
MGNEITYRIVEHDHPMGWRQVDVDGCENLSASEAADVIRYLQEDSPELDLGVVPMDVEPVAIRTADGGIRGYRYNAYDLEYL